MLDCPAQPEGLASSLKVYRDDSSWQFQVDLEQNGNLDTPDIRVLHKLDAIHELSVPEYLWTVSQDGLNGPNLVQLRGVHRRRGRAMRSGCYQYDTERSHHETSESRGSKERQHDTPSKG